MRRCPTICRLFLCFLGVVQVHGECAGQEPKLDKQRCPKPAEFAIVFSFGYAGDKMPADDAEFARLLTLIKEGGFNVVHCTYTDKRLELCKKHGVKMMVDLLAEQHHVFKAADKAQSLCEKLRQSADVWGYNIWNDNFGKTAAGRQRDVANVRQWDPTHPAYCGTYRTNGMGQLTNADIIGYYDFHWKRGTAQHFPHLLAYRDWSRQHDSWFYSWLSATSGQAGKGNFNRSLYSANTSIAFGSKGILWFLATDLMDAKKLTWTQLGQDIIKVNKEIQPLARELARLPLPSAIFSTPITRTMNNDPVADGKAVMPPGLTNHGFPEDAWLRPESGEFVLGISEHDEKRRTVFIANHNAYVEQTAALKLTKAAAVSQFKRAEGRWQPLEVREGAIRVQLQPGGGELLRFEMK
jgi:hypothetical protein